MQYKCSNVSNLAKDSLELKEQSVHDKNTRKFFPLEYLANIFVVNTLSFESVRKFDSLSGRKEIAMPAMFSQPCVILKKCMHKQNPWDV